MLTAEEQKKLDSLSSDRLRSLVLRHRFTGKVINFIDTDEWKAVPEPLLELVLAHPFCLTILYASSKERWDSIPTELQKEILYPHRPASGFLFHSSRDKWGAIPKDLQVYVVRHPNGIHYFGDGLGSGLEDFEALREMDDRILQLYAEYDCEDKGVSLQEFKIIVGPLLFREFGTQGSRDKSVTKKITDAQVENLIKFKNLEKERKDEGRTVPTCGYELELKTIISEREWYDAMVCLDVFDKGKDQLFEISSKVFKNGEMAALSVYSLMQSGLIPTDTMRPAKIPVHLNIGVPDELSEVVFNPGTYSDSIGSVGYLAEMKILHNILVLEHVSEERIVRKSDYRHLVNIKPSVGLQEGFSVSRVEMRGLDLHNTSFLQALRDAPILAQTLFCHIARENNIDYMGKERDRLADQWRERSEGVSTEVDISKMRFKRV